MDFGDGDGDDDDDEGEGLTGLLSRVLREALQRRSGMAIFTRHGYGVWFGLVWFVLSDSGETH